MAHRIGKFEGGKLLDQSVLTSPAVVSWKAITPTLAGASGALPWSSVDHASTKLGPLTSRTVTFSVVGVLLYVESVHSYVHVASEGCGSQSSASAFGANASTAATVPSAVATHRDLPRSALIASHDRCVSARRCYRVEGSSSIGRNGRASSSASSVRQTSMP